MPEDDSLNLKMNKVNKCYVYMYVYIYYFFGLKLLECNSGENNDPLS